MVITNYINHFVTVLFRPIIIVFVVMSVIWCIVQLNKKCNGKLNFLEDLVGIRG